MYRLSICCVLVLCLWGPAALSAQSVWTGPPERTDQVSVEWLRPEFDDEGTVSFFTSSLFLTGRAAVSDRLSVVGELPMSYARVETENLFGDPQTISSTVVGNPYLGIEWWGRTKSFFLELGGRVPAASNPPEFAAAAGTLTDLNRLGAYAVDQVPVRIVGNYQYTAPSSNLSVRLRGGTETSFPTAEQATGDALLAYGAQGWYRRAPFGVGVGITGRWSLTQGDAGFRESSFHQISAALRGTFGRVQPGLLVRMPVERVLRQVLPVVVGISVSVELSGTGPQ
jgi:hypothetical protein